MNTFVAGLVMVLAGSDCQGSCSLPDHAPALIVVTCPADVTLTIQGHPMHTTGTVRRFASPPLPPGRRYTYELHAFRSGQEVAVRHIEVEAGCFSSIRIDLDETIVNFGVDVDRLKRSAQQTGDDPLPDPSRPRLTVIGSDEERKRTRDELAGPLRELAADYVVRDYPPDHWTVTKPGFVTSGKPTIYGQDAVGRVLFRQDDPVNLKRNLEAVRKPSPDYKPERDPDYRQTPVLPVGWREALPLVCIALAGWLLWRSK